MSDFDLDAAVVAARRLADDACSDGVATRLRIRETLARRRTSSRRTTIVAALIATMFGSTAFAYYAGWRPPWSAPARPEPQLAEAPPPAPRARAHGSSPAAPRAETAPAVAAVDAPPPVHEAVSVESPRAETAPAVAAVDAPPPVHEAVFVEPARIEPARIEPASRERPRAGESSRRPRVDPALSPASERAPELAPAPARTPGPPAPARAPEPPAPAPSPAPDPELAAYRIAHEAHFRGGSAPAALAAWDRFLAAFPSGALAVDARYSRALLLIKLERWPEAKAALRPFAAAPPGTYRQAEAAKLLAAIPQ